MSTEVAPAAPPRRQEVTGLTIFGRDEFLSERWRYRAGEHVTILGPTGTGKTHLAYQLLGATARPGLPGVVLVMKPRDATVGRWSKTVGFRRVRTWPPGPVWPWQQKPSGWVLWPRHRFDPDLDNPHLYEQFRRAMLDSYRRGDRILFADEIAGISNELALHRESTTLWQRGRSMGAGVWAASQRPTHIPLLAYSSAEHLFLFADPDKRDRDRYAEIGGVDPVLIVAAVTRLQQYQCLYVRRTGARMCILDR